MASYHGPKAKIQRRFGEVLVPRPKYQRILDKRAYPPGDHGREKQFRSGRRSDFGLQLDEKQKLAFIYNIRERQLRNYYKKAAQMPGRTGENLLILLERRLDSFVYRSGLAATVWQARQFVGHGHFNVNGKRLDLPSYQMMPGDVVSFREKMHKNPHVIELMQQRVYAAAYISNDPSKFSAEFVRLPEDGEIPVPVDLQLVVEYYNRLT
jgi:small subunit ribosomal protein S4